MSHGGRRALEDVTLTIRRHEIFGLVGRHGAGKTSLLRAVVNLTTPEAGAIRVFGDAHDTPGSRTRLGYLPERFQPPGHLSGYDYVRLTLAFHGGRAKRAKTAFLAEELGLDPAALNRPIHSYPKGATQKLGLLAMLLSDLPLLILDAPMSGLDPIGRRLAKDQLKACRSRGGTIFMSSHVPSDHDELCDRVAILDRGRLSDVGSPAELKLRHGAPTLESAVVSAMREAQPVPAAARGRQLSSCVPRVPPD
jgi:ABC-2 type transport system ATP-binding protein